METKYVWLLMRSYGDTSIHFSVHATEQGATDAKEKYTEWDRCRMFVKKEEVKA